MSLRRSHQEAQRRIAVKVQWGRGFLFTTGVLVAALARLLGQSELSWAGMFLFFVASAGSAVMFAALAAGSVTATGPIPVRWLWMALDVGLFTWVVMATGGSQSFWFPWALANVAVAGFVSGERGAAAIMAGNLVAYLGAVALTEGASAAPLAAVLVRLVLLYGAGFYAVRGICRLHARDRRIAHLRQLENQQASELQQLKRTVEEQAAQLDRLTSELRKVAMTDPQTGIPNRRSLKGRIEEDIAMVKRAYSAASDGASDVAVHPGRDLGFLLIDIDRFRQVNDEHGHEAGDEILRQVAVVVDRTVRGMDTVIRWDNDEFLVVLRQISREMLRDVAERVMRGIRAETFRLPDQEQLALTCSSGFSQYPLGDPDRFSWQEIVQVADGALQLAKKDGRDRCFGVAEGTRDFDRVGARLATHDLTEAEQRGYVRVLRDRGD